MTQPDREAWRGIVAALGNDTARTVYAEIVVGDGGSATLDALSPSRRRHVLSTLTRTGLVTDVDGRLRADGGVFTAALAASAAPKRPQGLDRFLDADGKIAVYPADKTVRAQLLTQIAARALPADEVLTEREVNERLSPFTDDVAVLRRYLVDQGELERTRSGSEYARR